MGLGRYKNPSLQRFWDCDVSGTLDCDILTFATLVGSTGGLDVMQSSPMVIYL